MATTSPLRSPRRASPVATRRIESSSWRYVMTRPLGPSMMAGLSPSRRACRSMYSVMETSGTVTSALRLLTIIAALGA